MREVVLPSLETLRELLDTTLLIREILERLHPPYARGGHDIDAPQLHLPVERLEFAARSASEIQKGIDMVWYPRLQLFETAFRYFHDPVVVRIPSLFEESVAKVDACERKSPMHGREQCLQCAFYSHSQGCSRRHVSPSLIDFSNPSYPVPLVSFSSCGSFAMSASTSFIWNSVSSPRRAYTASTKRKSSSVSTDQWYDEWSKSPRVHGASTRKRSG